MRKAKERDDKAAAALNNPSVPSLAQDAANAQQKLDTQRANVSIGVWAAATLIGMMLSAVTGAYILDALGVTGLGGKEWIDVVVTGVAIGAGTKPVHDLITRIDAAKNAAKDPPETK